MADRTVVVRLKADIGDLVGKMAMAGASVKEFGATATASTSGAGRSLQDFADRSVKAAQTNTKSFQQVAKASAITGGILVAGATAAVVAFAQFDAAMSAVRANVDDKSAPSMKRLANAALEAGKTTVFSATDAAEAENELAKAGISAADIVGGALKSSLNLASAGQIDLASAAEITSSTMVQFGLQASSAAHIADDLAAGADKSLGGVQDLGEALKYAGPQAHALGINLDQTVGTLAQFASAGIVGSMAGTGLRQILVSLAAPTKQASDTMKQYGINVFDAQGKFVGMASVAQQLHEKLGTLTQAQQQQALSNIFTARSMSEVNILMRQGAAGTDKWTKAVNDNGFAAKQAATKLDNLQGDVHKLGNAIDVALIQGGSGANGALRGMAQGADKAVVAFSNMPEPMQKGLTLFTGLTGAGLLVVGVLGSLIPKVQAFRTALADMGPAGEAANAGLGKAAAGAAKFGVAVGVAEAVAQGINAIGPSADSQVAGVNTLSNSLVRLGQTGQANAPLVAMFGKNLGQLAEQVKLLAAPSGYQKFNQTMNSVFSFGTLQDHAVQVATANMKGLDAAMTNLVASGHTAAAQAAFEALATKVNAGGLSVADLRKELPGYEDALAGLKTNSDAAAGSTGKLGSATDKTTNSMQQQITAGQMLKNVLDILSGTNLSAAQASDAWHSSILSANSALKQNGHTMSQNTAAGLANRQALQQMISAAEQDAEAQANLTGKQSTGIAVLKQHKAELITVATQMFGNKKAAEAYVNSLLQIPTSVATHTPVPDLPDSTNKVQNLHDTIAKLHDRLVTVETGPQTARSLSEVQSLQRTIAALRSKVIEIQTIRSERIITTHQTLNEHSDVRDPNNRWGGVYSHAYARGGTTTGTVARIAPAKTLYQWAEPATGGEAFVPKRGDASRSRSIVDQAAAWYGGQVAWGAGNIGGTTRPYAATVNASTGSSSTAAGGDTTTIMFPDTSMTPASLNHALQVRDLMKRTGRPS